MFILNKMSICLRNLLTFTKSYSPLELCFRQCFHSKSLASVAIFPCRVVLKHFFVIQNTLSRPNNRCFHVGFFAYPKRFSCIRYSRGQALKLLFNETNKWFIGEVIHLTGGEPCMLYSTAAYILLLHPSVIKLLKHEGAIMCSGQLTVSLRLVY